MLASACLAIALTVTAVAAAPDTTAADAAVRAADAARIKATTTNDFPALEAILADDLTYTHSSGVTDTKAQFLTALKTGRSRYTSITPQDVVVRVYGLAAVVTGRAAVSVVVDGKPSDIQLRFTSVYVQRDGRWQFAAWQSTRLTQP